MRKLNYPIDPETGKYIYPEWVKEKYRENLKKAHEAIQRRVAVKRRLEAMLRLQKENDLLQQEMMADELEKKLKATVTGRIMLKSLEEN